MTDTASALVEEMILVCALGHKRKLCEQWRERAKGIDAREAWQPIETAPRKGEGGDAILIATAGPQIDIAWWDPDEQSFRDCFYGKRVNALRWRPLPEPPR